MARGQSLQRLDCELRHCLRSPREEFKRLSVAIVRHSWLRRWRVVTPSAPARPKPEASRLRHLYSAHVQEWLLPQIQSVRCRTCSPGWSDCHGDRAGGGPVCAAALTGEQARIKLVELVAPPATMNELHYLCIATAVAEWNKRPSALCLGALPTTTARVRRLMVCKMNLAVFSSPLSEGHGPTT